MILLGFLRKWNGALLAALLALAVLAPTIDSFICISDVGNTATAVQEQVAGMDKDILDQSHDDGDASCSHGHCHHWVGFTKVGERMAFNANAKHLTPTPALSTAPPSAPQNALLRPPQA